MRYDIDFREGGNSGPCLRSGWSSQEKDHVWSLGPRSMFALPDLPRDTRIQVELELEGLPEFREQSLAIIIGNERVDGFIVTERCKLVFTIPPQAEHSPRGTTFEFVHEQHREANSHPDPRPLALRFFHIALTPDA